MEPCRLCGNEVEPRSQEKTKFRDLIKRAFGKKVDEDCPCYSKRVCETCRLDLQAYRRHYQHRKKPYNFKIHVVEIEHKIGCHDKHAKTSEPLSLQQAANDSARTHNFAAWEQNNTLIYARICKDASSPVQVSFVLFVCLFVCCCCCYFRLILTLLHVLLYLQIMSISTTS